MIGHYSLTVRFGENNRSAVVSDMPGNERDQGLGRVRFDALDDAKVTLDAVGECN